MVVFFVGFGVIIGYIMMWVPSFFALHPERSVIVHARVNWVEYLSAKTRAPNLMNGLNRIEPCIYGYAGGTLDGMAMLSSLDTAISQAITTQMGEALPVRLPSRIKMLPLTTNILCRLLFNIQGQPLHRVAYKYSLTPVDIPTKSYHKDNVSMNTFFGQSALAFIVPTGRLFTARFTQSPLPRFDQETLPYDFFRVAPSTVDRGFPQEAPPTTGANSVAMTWGAAIVTRQPQDFARVMLNTDTMGCFLLDGGVLVETGGLGKGAFVLSGMTNGAQMVLSPWAWQPFDLALTLSAKPEHGSFFCVRGGCSDVRFTALSGWLTIGQRRVAFSEGDVLALLGNLQTALDFLPAFLPVLDVEGKATSVLLNDEELLPNRLLLVPPDIRGAVVGGFIGFLLSIVTRMLMRSERGGKNFR